MFMSRKGLSIASILVVGALAASYFAWVQPKSSASEGRYKLRWVLAHEPTSVFERSAKAFKEELAAVSNGEIEVEILTVKEYADKYNGGHEFGGDEVLRKLQNGEFEMSQTYTTVLGKRSPSMWVLDLPFLFRDHDHAAKVLEGEIGQRLLASLESENIRGLAFTYSGGFRVIPSVDRSITKLEDFKGMTIRTSLSPVAQSIFKTLGANPMPSSLSEGEVALEQGDINAMETTYVRYTPTQRKQAPHLNETHHSLFLTGVVMNEAIFKKMPSKYQEAIMAAALKAGRTEREDSIADGLKARAEFQQEGVRLISMSLAETERMRKALDPVYDEYREFFGAELISSIVNTR